MQYFTYLPGIQFACKWDTWCIILRERQLIMRIPTSGKIRTAVSGYNTYHSCTDFAAPTSAN